ncbi:MAG: hypothetical protein EOO63_06165 [Hymenobacter sp.]|nr:MAG: hypothetical protein EOO63_06165 [Hymenobacter sp.]
MKITYAVACFVLGFAAIFVGALIKILHWFRADLLLLAGMALVLIGALLLVLRLFRSPAPRQ